MTGCEIFLDPTLIFFIMYTTSNNKDAFCKCRHYWFFFSRFFLPEINECQVSFLQTHIVSAHDFFLCSTPHKPLKKCFYSGRTLYNYLFIIFFSESHFSTAVNFIFCEKKIPRSPKCINFSFHDGWPYQPWQFFFILWRIFDSNYLLIEASL